MCDACMESQAEMYQEEARILTEGIMAAKYALTAGNYSLRMGLTKTEREVLDILDRTMDRWKQASA